MKLKNTKICITGIGGFIGKRLAEILKEKGAIVSGLEIDSNTSNKLRELGYRVITGNTSNHQDIDQLLENQDFVVHTAAIVKEGGSLEEFREVNVKATVNLAVRAKEMGLRGMVHLSSVMVYGFDYIENISEDGELRGENNPYCITKIEGERELLKIMTPEFGIILIRPGDVYGADSKPWVLRPLELMKMGLFSLPDGGSGKMNATYIDNLCEGIILGIEKEVYGEAFNITDGTTISWRDYFYQLAEAGGYSKPLSLPTFIAKSLVDVVNLFFSFTGKPSPVSSDGINFILRKHAVSIDKAKKILGYKPLVSLEDGLKRTLDWVKNNKVV
jgi:nucleoside-diphosphate-sugar epimerase